MKKKILIASIIVIFSANAHRGRTDSSGGHNCSQKSINKGLCSGYHSHRANPTPAPQSNQSKKANTIITSGNQSNQSFNKAKKMMMNKVYFDNQSTFYCHAKFNNNKNITDFNGFESDKFKKRSKRIEWEHIVPAENFGRTFSEWRDGHSDCINNKGKSFKGRNCASKTNKEYRLMQSDLYNLVPAIGAVNAMRSNYNFTQFSSNETPVLGSCTIDIADRKVQPPSYTRGFIARTYLYMQDTYPRYKMSKQQNQLMKVWDNKYPVTDWECKRTKRIEKLQGNKNKILANRCNY